MPKEDRDKLRLEVGENFAKWDKLREKRFETPERKLEKALLDSVCHKREREREREGERERERERASERERERVRAGESERAREREKRGERFETPK